MKLLLFALLCLAFAYAVPSVPKLPDSLVTIVTTTVADSGAHPDHFPQNSIILDKSTGFVIDLEPGVVRMTCFNVSDASYTCFAVAYGTDCTNPDCSLYVGFEHSYEDMLNGMGAPLVPLDASSTYMSSEIYNGVACDIFFDPTTNATWRYTRDAPRTPVSVNFPIDNTDGMNCTFESTVPVATQISLVYAYVPTTYCVPTPIDELSSMFVQRDIPVHADDEIMQNANKVYRDEGKSFSSTNYERFNGMTWGEFRSTLGVIPAPASNAVPYKPATSRSLGLSDLPTEFDVRDKWAYLNLPAWNQNQCGSCWAHAATRSFGDRMAVASGGVYNDSASRQYLISCDMIDNGCEGGASYISSQYIRDNGVVSNTCVPTYTSSFGQVPSCQLQCENPADDYTIYKALDAFHVASEVDIMYELVNYGPLRADFLVYSDFPAYQSGVYRHDPTASIEGGHAVTLIGYGVENNTKYWLLMNSWSPSWGINGAFKIVRGENECNVEDSITGGHAYVNASDNICNYDMCHNGVCVNDESGAYCNCTDSWSGLYCNIWIDPCMTDACNGFECNSTFGYPDVTCDCSGNGIFGGDNCNEYDCHAYTPIAGYTTSACTGTLVGDTCTLSCAAGYNGTVSTINCIVGGWELPSTCVAISACGNMSTYPGYKVGTCFGIGGFGTSCESTCDVANGYAGVSSSIVCTSNGLWSAPAGCAVPEKKKTDQGMSVWSWIGFVAGGFFLVGIAGFAGFSTGNKKKAIHGQPLLNTM
jgi:cathepsin B